MTLAPYSPEALRPIRVDNIDQIRELGRLTFPDRVTGIKYHPAGTYLAIRLATKIILWNVHTGEQYLSLDYSDAWIEALAFSHDGKYLVISVGNPLNKSRANSSLHCWHVEKGEEEYEWTPNVGIASSIAFSPQDSDIIALVSYDREVFPPNAMQISNVGIELWNRKTLLRRFTEFEQFFGEGENELHPWLLEFSLNGKTLFVCLNNSRDWGGQILAWEGLGSGELKAVTNPGESFYGLKQDKHGYYLAMSNPAAKKLSVRSLRSGTDVYSEKDALQSSSVLGFDSESTILIIGRSEDDKGQMIDFIDISSGKTIRKLFEHYERVGAVAFSPDNRILAIEMNESHEPGMQEVLLWGIPQ